MLLILKCVLCSLRLDTNLRYRSITHIKVYTPCLNLKFVTDISVIGYFYSSISESVLGPKDHWVSGYNQSKYKFVVFEIVVIFCGDDWQLLWTNGSFVMTFVALHTTRAWGTQWKVRCFQCSGSRSLMKINSLKLRQQAKERNFAL